MNIVKLPFLLTTFTMLLFAQNSSMKIEEQYVNFPSLKASDNLIQRFNLGFSNTTGNTNNLDVNLKYDLAVSTKSYAERLLKVVFDSSLFYTEQDYQKSNEEYLVNLGLEQDIGQQWLSYLAFNWLRNPEFKNYNHKISLGVGLGRDIFFDGKQSLTIKMGTAYNREDYANNQPTEDFKSLNEYIEYKNQLNKISKLYLKTGALQHFQGLENDYEVLGILGIIFQVGNKINLNLEQEVAYDNLPPIGFKKTDTKSIVRLGYKF